MNFVIEGINIELRKDAKALRANILDEGYYFSFQSFQETKDTITSNFYVVKEHYSQTALLTISMTELNEVSLKIVLYYFQLYNSWRSIYEKYKDKDLTFLNKDYTHPYTYDLIINYFRLKYPEDYIKIAAAMINKSPSEVLKYKTDRDDFYNSFR
ncbi:MAG: hypothetical protein WBO36_06645 [Saprospiraceae bacterium]